MTWFGCLSEGVYCAALLPPLKLRRLRGYLAMLQLGEMRRKTIDCIRQVVGASGQQAGAQPGVGQAPTRNQERK